MKIYVKKIHSSALTYTFGGKIITLINNNQKILILNNVCGPLTAIGKAFIQLGYQVEFFEADPDGCRDIEQAKTVITAFNPDFILQQNFNVYMLSGDFGEQLLSWIETSRFKQLFWFLARPDCMSQRHTFDEWVSKGYLKNSEVFCTSKAMMPFFDEHDITTHHLPIAIEISSIEPIANKDDYSIVSYFSNTVTAHGNSPTQTVLTSLSNQETALRYFLMSILVAFPSYNQQTIIESVIGPVRHFFASADIDFLDHQIKRDKLEKDLQHLPIPLINAVLHQVEFVYCDYVSCYIYQKIKPKIQHTSGSPFWDALENSSPKVGPASVCQLDNIRFKKGTVVSFSPFISMEAPSSAPLSVIASGNLVICENRGELVELIPSEYVMTYQSVDDISYHLAQLAESKSDLSERKAAAQDYVLTHHTFQQRARELMDLVNR